MHPHRRGRSLSSIGMGRKQEEDDHLALFNDMDSGNDNGNGFPELKVPSGRGCEDLLRADGDKNDYEWLLTPPETPLFPSMETKDRTAGFSQGVSSVVHAANALKSSRTDSSSKIMRGNLTSRQMISSGLNNSMNIGSVRSSMLASTGPTPSRSSTPTRSRVPASVRSSTPVPRSTIPASSRSSTPSTRTTVPTSSRPSTPTTRSTIPTSPKPLTPATRSTAPTPRSTMPTSKSLSRPSTPTRQQSTPTLIHGSCVPPSRSFPASNISSMLSRNPPASRGTSPAQMSRPSPPLVLPGFSLDAPPNLRTTMHDRPISAMRSRPGAPSSVRPPTEIPSASGRPRGKSCSPIVTRGRISSERHSNGKPNLQATKPHINGAEVTMPVLLSSKMVDKLSATKGHEDQPSPRSNISNLQSRRQVKSTSVPDSSGFGRTISKKSLDMALRHMDIRQSAPSNTRPLTNFPTSDLYSVRLGSTKSKATKISESPIATNSSASSDRSTKIAPYPQGNTLDDFQTLGERENIFSPLSQHESILFKGDELSTNWLHGPTNGGDKFDQALLFERFDESFDAFTLRTGKGADSLHKRVR
ncbi:uncharacterized protein LOC131029721 isoform X2 [Cryptomeria japonica]|uniref:uncharacterized protein LOC131029721 isoform X2 n=1 Tax=Cryptomeria japonica TaxID=3369 RepID=UPI0027D9E2CC|nr:uncharacterized protein LOC131029721 isoform X2 [Cryptomeria japonica]